MNDIQMTDEEIAIDSLIQKIKEVSLEEDFEPSVGLIKESLVKHFPERAGDVIELLRAQYIFGLEMGCARVITMSQMIAERSRAESSGDAAAGGPTAEPSPHHPAQS